MPLALAVVLALACSVHGAERPPANVPPTLEIEVLDPNADPQGRPAVELREVDGMVQVDIPPTVLVHRYYYSGDRSFQAQLLPGGPCILVVNHPKTGERCYINVQMLPGAPRVTYTSHSIEYDYGDHGITLQFGLFGQPSVRYRSGPTWRDRLSHLTHFEQVRAGVHHVGGGVKRGVAAGHQSLHEAVIDTYDLLETATLPVQNVLRMMPLGAALFDPNKAALRAEKIAQHQRDHAVERAARDQLIAEQTIPTVR